MIRTLACLTLVLASQHVLCQSFVYVEPGNASCPPAPAPSSAAPKTVHGDAQIPGSITVSCGFGQGSYTVTLSSTDPSARFSPKSFLVNFGSIVGDGTFTVTFRSVGVQTVSTAITSNMGSPAVTGRFASATNEFNVVSRP